MLTINQPLTNSSASVPVLKQSHSSGTGFLMNRKNAYWISQVIGWSIYAGINLTVTVSFYPLNTERVLVSALIIILGIGFTHYYRTIIRSKNWSNLSLKKIIPRIAFASILIGVIMYLILLSASIITEIYTFDKLKIGSIFIGIFNLTSVNFVWSLIYFAFHYLENIKKVEIESLIWEAAVKDFELKTLKSQLNPHFMFNAMNSIRALIEEDPSSAKTAITKLSNILRYSLKIERSETVPLDEEIQTVNDYLALETIRFEERLRYNISIDPTTKKFEIPPMMIQTLVENGIKHGVSKRVEGGSINVTTEIVDSKLRIQIKNSGYIPPDALKNSKGFGINNTRQRLNLLYGDAAFFSITNLGDNQVLSEILIPSGGRKNESYNN